MAPGKLQEYRAHFESKCTDFVLLFCLLIGGALGTVCGSLAALLRAVLEAWAPAFVFSESFSIFLDERGSLLLPTERCFSTVAALLQSDSFLTSVSELALTRLFLARTLVLLPVSWGCLRAFPAACICLRWLLAPEGLTGVWAPPPLPGPPGLLPSVDIRVSLLLLFAGAPGLALRSSSGLSREWRW